MQRNSMRLGIRQIIGILCIAIAALVSTVLGSAGALGRVNAIETFAGVSHLLGSRWEDVMLLGPPGCVLFAVFGTGIFLSGMASVSTAPNVQVGKMGSGS